MRNKIVKNRYWILHCGRIAYLPEIMEFYKVRYVAAKDAKTWLTSKGCKIRGTLSASKKIVLGNGLYIELFELDKEQAIKEEYINEKGELL